jgi:putative SOS response-associated peptidase YedK
MRAVHHRIPVHLTHDEARRWLDPDTDVADLKALLAPTIRVPIQLTPVSTWVNNARNKDGRCVEAVGESRVVAVA